MAEMQPEWSWVEAAVDRTADHLVIGHDDFGQAILAYIGSPADRVFPVEFVATVDGHGVPESVRADIVGELDFYLVEKGEPNPWGYARYHCGTLANVYSTVHWGGWSAEVAARSGNPPGNA